MLLLCNLFGSVVNQLALPLAWGCVRHNVGDRLVAMARGLRRTRVPRRCGDCENGSERLIWSHGGMLWTMN